MTASPRARPRLDAVLAFHYRPGHTGVRVRCDLPFKLERAWLDVPFEAWKDWRRVRLCVRPDGVAPRSVLMLADLHGKPLLNGRAHPVRRINNLDVDLLPARATGMAFALVIAGPGNIATVRVFLGLADHDAANLGMAELGLLPPAPRVFEIS